MSMNDGKGNTESATTVRVNIYNQFYNLRAEGDGDYLKRIAAYVDKRMQEISSQTHIVDYAKIAVLAALNIADELHRVKQAAEQQEPAALRSPEPPQTPNREAQDSALKNSERDEPESWSYADIFEAPPARKDIGQRMSQQVTAKLRQLRSTDDSRGPGSDVEK